MIQASQTDSGGARRRRLPWPRRTIAALAATALGLLVAGGAQAAWLRPLSLEGDFAGEADAVNVWRADGSLDVMVLMRVPNRELSFTAAGNEVAAHVKAWVRLRGQGDAAVEREREYSLPVASSEEAASGTLGQVFALILPDVPLRWGVMQIRLEDLNHGRTSLLSRIGGVSARSEAIGDWEAPSRARLDEGLGLGDPLFLALAPLEAWRQRDPTGLDLERDDVLGCLQPHRRYGLEADKLQLYFQVDPPRQGPVPDALNLQVTARDLEFALRDTVVFDQRRRADLAAGRPVGVFYQLDVNLLPAGTYQLGCAPADGRGRSWLTEFDVSWQLGTIGRPVDDVLGEGRTVFSGDALDRFLGASPVERSVMLEEFWADHDPDPRTPQNEARLEFQRRVAYVRQHLGGFGAGGAADSRGEVYLLLGPPDETQAQAMPLNQRDLEDATIRVYERHAPERLSQTAKGDQSTGKFYSPDGPVPLPDTYRTRRELAAHRHDIGQDQAFELWIYEDAGRQLFVNRFSGQQLGLRFLFVDVTGTGKNWKLQSTNASKLSDGVGG